MTPRRLLIAWLAAVALLAMLSVWPAVLADRAARAQRSPVVAIGSSLLAYAIPVAGQGPTSLLGDGRSHHRIAVRRITEAELLSRLAVAIEQRPAVVLLEANPLLFDFADEAHRRPCDGWPYRVQGALAAGQRQVADAYRRLAGRPLMFAYSGDPPNLAAAQFIGAAEIARRYPIVLRAPCDEPRLRALLARARAQATRVVLLLPPRSPVADRLLGAAVTRDLRRRAELLASRLHVELFAPPGPWRNGEFVDAAHLNRVGRAHFLAELQRWWAAAP